MDTLVYIFLLTMATLLQKVDTFSKPSSLVYNLNTSEGRPDVDALKRNSEISEFDNSNVNANPSRLNNLKSTEEPSRFGMNINTDPSDSEEMNSKVVIVPTDADLFAGPRENTKQKKRFRRSYGQKSKCIIERKTFCKMLTINRITKNICLTFQMRKCVGLD